MANRLLDRYGSPLRAGTNGDARANGESQRQSMQPAVQLRPALRALYDAAASTPTTAYYWPGADDFDADRSNTQMVRQQTRKRARWLVANDSLARGIVRTMANHEVGCGPGLQLLTKSDAFNAMVQQRWDEWTMATGFGEKLHTMVQSRVIDGECFALLGSNPNLDCDVKLDIKLLETDQIFTPWLPWAVPNRIDGVWFDDWGNPTFYDVLRWHPGGVFPYWTWLYDTVPAQYIVQLMRRERPNQHRGMSEFTAAMRLFAERKRFLEAVIKAAETHANISILLETQSPPGLEETTPAEAIGAAEIPQNMVAALPWGYKASGFKAEQPATTFEMFDRRLITAIAMTFNMPYAIAACDSSQTNFSSGRLDHQTYFSMVRVNQRLIARTVCTRVFREWFKEACRVYKWSVPDSPAPPHTWHWVEPEYCDPEAEANSIGTELAIGIASHSAVLTARGQDAKAVHKKAAEDLGFDTVPEYLAWVRANISAKFGGQNRTPEPVLEKQDPTDADVAQTKADVAAMAHILETASPDTRRAIAAWARGAMALGSAV